MGALSSIPLCSRGREVDGEVDTTANRPEKLENKEETIVVQPETANNQGVGDEKKSIEASLRDDEELGGASSDSDETNEVLDGVKGIDVSKQVVSSQKQDDDGNEEVSLDDETNEVEDGIHELHDLEKPLDQHLTGLSTEEDTYRKTPTMLDTTSAITNMLSEIVMEADSREVVGR